jgi:hypothetical protein
LLALPLSDPAVEHRDCRVAEHAEHPPCTRSAHHEIAVVHDDLVLAADAERADRCRELRGRRQHVRQRRSLVRYRVDVEELGTRDVRGFEFLARLARRRRYDEGRVEDAHERIRQMRREPGGVDEIGGKGVVHRMSP